MSPKGGRPTLEELKHPPVPADPNEIASIARQGIIGQCLQDALNDILSEDAATTRGEEERRAAAASKEEDDEKDESKEGEEESDGKSMESPGTKTNKYNTACTSTLKLQQHMADNIMKEFGRAVARTKWWTSNNSNNNSSKYAVPPSALIRGRLDHYNRFQGKWRIIVKDAQWKRRATLEKDRKKTQQAPLWDATKTKETRDSISLQILAYDDL